MIQPNSRLRVADNTGARVVECIRILGRSQKPTAGVGDVITATLTRDLGGTYGSTSEFSAAYTVGVPDTTPPVISNISTSCGLSSRSLT